MSLYNKLKPQIDVTLQEVIRHFIDPLTWGFKSLILGFERLHGSHSAQALGKVTVDILKRFQIQDSICAITTDSASVNTAMFRYLERERLLGNFSQQDSHVRCMGHVINLAVQSLLKSLKITALTQEALGEDLENNRAI